MTFGWVEGDWTRATGADTDIVGLIALSDSLHFHNCPDLISKAPPARHHCAANPWLRHSSRIIGHCTCCARVCLCGSDWWLRALKYVIIPHMRAGAVKRGRVRPHVRCARRARSTDIEFLDALAMFTEGRSSTLTDEMLLLFGGGEGRSAALAVGRREPRAFRRHTILFRNCVCVCWLGGRASVFVWRRLFG